MFTTVRTCLSGLRLLAHYPNLKGPAPQDLRGHKLTLLYVAYLRTACNVRLCSQGPAAQDGRGHGPGAGRGARHDGTHDVPRQGHEPRGAHRLHGLHRTGEPCTPSHGLHRLANGRVPLRGSSVQADTWVQSCVTSTVRLNGGGATRMRERASPAQVLCGRDRNPPRPQVLCSPGQTLYGRHHSYSHIHLETPRTCYPTPPRCCAAATAGSWP